MFCSKCGKEIADGTKFCPSCGQEIGGKTNSESAFTGIAKVASEARKKASEKLGDINEKLKEANEKEDEKEKNKIEPALGEEKDWQSVADIISKKKDGIFKLQGAKNALLGTTSFKMRNEISDSKASNLSKKVAQKKIQVSDIVAVYDNKNEGKIVFTDYAMYATEKMMLPIVVKYADITEVGINKENEEQVIVRLSNGLEWTVTNNNYVDMKAFAQIIKIISDFAKNRGEDERSRNIVSSEEQEATPFLKLIGFVLLTAIFSWNCHAICHNFSAGEGIVWAIIGIVVNIAILYPLAGGAALFISTVARKPDLAEKLVAKKIIWVFPVILFLLFGLRSCSSPKSQIAATAEQIIEENSYYEVEKITGMKKISKGVYSAIAVLDNGYTLTLTITVKDDGSIYCQWQ